MSSLTKMLAILDLFSEQKPIWTAEEIINEFDFSVPTGYRYVRELSQAGLLARVKGGSYVIGPKIIKLDRQVRISDPLIKIGKPIMENLVQLTGCEVLLSNIYNDEILVVHMETPDQKESNISYSRGKPHPLFKSSTAKIIVANLQRNDILKLFQTRQEEIAEAGLGDDWEEFKKNLSKVRRQGYCISHGELDAGLSAIAAPIFSNNQVNGSLSLVLPTDRFSVFNTDRLIEVIKDSVDRISNLISDPYCDLITDRTAERCDRAKVQG
jgi:DNA-binding IclR family transcriptional regulator